MPFILASVRQQKCSSMRIVSTLVSELCNRLFRSKAWLAFELAVIFGVLPLFAWVGVIRVFTLLVIAFVLVVITVTWQPTGAAIQWKSFLRSAAKSP